MRGLYIPRFYFLLNIFNIRLVTIKPPTQLIVANITAINPSHVPNSPPTLVAIIAPTIAIPEIALDQDIRGVCNVGGTLVIISFPTKIARINTVRILTISIYNSLIV